MKSIQLKQAFSALLLLITFNSNAVISRHDIESAQYNIDIPPDFFVDMPFQGAAVLIDKHWLLAPAHVIYTNMYDYESKPIKIHGVENQIAEVIRHPEYESNAGTLNESKDIVLIRLLNPVNHVRPIAIYGGDNELGMIVTGYGRGAIGNGLIGEVKDSQGPGLLTYTWYQITKFFTDWVFTQDNYPLKRYANQITAASNQWLRFTFEKGNNALPLEGTIGSGDSGGAG